MWLQIFASLVIGAFTLIYLLLRKRFSYWADRGIVHEKPVLLYGNLREVGRTQSLRQPFNDFYMKYKNVAPFGGFYLFMRRAVVLLDLELVKHVMIKDFSNFAHRGNYYNEEDDPITAHLFNLDGPKWRSMRTKLSPTFTSGKMKFMFPTVVEVAQRFITVFEELLVQETQQSAAKGDDSEISIEIKELLARFTTDVIGTCAFGLECNSLRDPQTEFRLMGKKAFEKRRHGKIVMAFMLAFPDYARKLGLKMAPEDVSTFFLRIVRETVEYREREGIQRNDFLNLLIELKNRGDTEGLTMNEISAEAFVFFLAGFETSSSTMGFAFYELACNPQIQDRARAEINEMLERHDGKFTYEGMRELKYLQQILHETMRHYSIASLLLRKTINDYPVPNSKHVIEKGTIVIVPVDAIHHDPDIYPDPEVFDPERFTPAEVEKRDSMAWLAFGEGPRNCIGMRFGEMQSIIGLAMLLQHFRFTPSKQTQIPIKIDLKNFLLASEGGIFLNVEKI